MGLREDMRLLMSIPPTKPIKMGMAGGKVKAYQFCGQCYHLCPHCGVLYLCWRHSDKANAVHRIVCARHGPMSWRRKKLVKVKLLEET